MDIGSQFDDDFFEKPKEKEGSDSSYYEAKVCMPLWYMEKEATKNEKGDVLVALKHQADYYYFSENYAKSAEVYERCLELVPATNNTWKREFMENLSRSLLHLGNAEKALEWSLKLYDSSCSTDQKIISMNLLATVCHKLGKFKEELEALHCCIDAHKSCPEFWLRLGLCYAGLFKINLPGCSAFNSVLESECEPCCAFSSKQYSCHCSSVQEKEVLSPPAVESAIPSCSSSSSTKDICSSTESTVDTNKCEICALGVQIVSTCLIHTRVLMDSGGTNLLGVERDERIKEKISNSLKHMEVEQSFIDVASKMLGSDFLAGLQEVRESSEQSNFSEMLKPNAERSDL
ncbi:uncharacterized protein C8orf76 homolog [Uloborus diversus]|uniref:uncharacterized protein C8orf76 homolog n=1 Tax=Uloborus diversus TaxID=327109 RepID=UPI00240A23E7|nr:uncharacterized protein C8orf76 homolog [Uloborus diversus]